MSVLIDKTHMAGSLKLSIGGLLQWDQDLLTMREVLLKDAVYEANVRAAKMLSCGAAQKQSRCL